MADAASDRREADRRPDADAVVGGGRAAAAAADDVPPVGAPPPPAPPSRADGPVFVSHSSRDAAVATQLVNALEAAGVRCWVAPRDIPAAADYNAAIMDGLAAARLLVLVYSRHSVASDPVRREVERALHHKVPVLPVRLDESPPSKALEYMIASAQWVDAFPPPADRHLDKVVAAVHRTLGRASSAPRLDPDAAPKYIGPYRILEPLGAGGMGTVYKAEQRSPVKRVVAVKRIKPGFDSAEVVARFEAERQALARMDHPNVAKVLDAGADDRGRPYFVMEYVPGVPITQFADDKKLTVRQRLALFTQACDAIAHAHTKSILHRDVKPGNVLAYLADGKPTVKVIDFGIAKALTGDRLTDRTLHTSQGQAIGTYEAMSPEQADGSPDIDTRTDVYSLGVLLYELLTGSQPFDKATLAKAADAEVRRIIREVEPPRPSTRLSGLAAEAGTKVAAARQAVLAALAGELRSELEWIPLKAMRKERERRYASPLQLAEDCQRYLDGKPLLAGPESRVYRGRKFARRNRAVLTTAAGIALAAGGGVAVYLRDVRAEQIKTSAALSEARAGRAEANAQREVAEEQRGEADRQRGEAVHQKGEADRQEAVARATARDARRQLADVFARDGWAQVEAGDPSVALLWFARALETVNGDGPEAERARIRFATTLATAPRLLDVPVPSPLETSDITFSRERRLRLNGSVVRILGAEADRPAVPDLQHADTVWYATFSPDGSQVATASDDRTARVWDASSCLPASPPLWHEDAVLSVVYRADGRVLLTVSRAGTARVWDAVSGQTATKRFLASAANSKRIVVPLGAASATGPSPPWQGPAFLLTTPSPNGHRVAAVCPDSRVRVWDATTGELIGSPLLHELTVVAIAFSLDGRQLATGGTDGAARVWDAATGAAITPPLRHESTVWSVSFSADGQRVATASPDKSARVWDVSTGRPAGPPLRHAGSVARAVFSPDGRWVATASADKTARVWDAATGQPITPPLPHDDAVSTAEFSSDGRWLITKDLDRISRRWDVGPDERASEDLSALAELLAARRVDPTGAFVTLTADEWQARWHALRLKYPGQFRPRPPPDVSAPKRTLK